MDIIDRLKEGNARFQNDALEHQLQDEDRRLELTGGQSPSVIVLSCADSRVVPELAFDMGLGEVFVLRVAGNIANTETIASIEYAVAHLKPTPQAIVVLGHESCGAVTAAIGGGDNGYNLNILLSQIAPAVAATPNGSVNEVVQTNARLHAKELVDRSAIIREAVASGAVKIIPAYYNLGSGAVDFLD